MRTTILAYVIAVLGFVTICGGVYSFFNLWNERATLKHYAIMIGMICGGFAMGGIAQALRLLVAIAHTIQPH
jgi:membrane-associated PAP2 superfamily phosphatase